MFGINKRLRACKQQIADLEATCSSLQSKVSETYKNLTELNAAYQVLKGGLNKDVPWYENTQLISGLDHESRRLSYDIQSSKKRDIVYEMPSLKPDSNIVFHGGCLGCASQRLHGLGRCKGCNYFSWGSGLPDLSIYQSSQIKTPQ